VARILIVDDEPSLVMLVKFILEKDGHAVETAYNGVEACAALGLEPRDDAKPLPELVILDVMMPIMDGHTVSVKMKDDARTAKLPILVLTAKGDMRDLFEAMPNVAAFFSKPFTPPALREAVGKALKRS